MKFGGIVSTSNKYDGHAEYVDVKCDSPLMWSMGLKDEDWKGTVNVNYDKIIIY